MPNWCENELIISGKSDEMENFIRFLTYDFKRRKKTIKKNDDSPVNHDILSIDAVIPYPVGLPYSTNDKNNGYEWCYNNWDTKWDLSHIMPRILPKLPYDGDSLIFFFDTAWGPPSAYVKALGKEFPNLQFVLLYSEPMVGFSGEIHVFNDEVYEEYEDDSFDTYKEDEEEI